MGLLSNSVSLSQFDIVGDLPEGDLAQWIGERLVEHAFVPIDRSAEELALGWVELDDFQRSDFTSPVAWWRDDYVAFTFRRDQRRLPSALVRGEFQREQQRFLAENPSYQRVPKDKNDELKELVRSRLLVRVLPTPTLMDVVWHLPSRRLTFASVSTRAIDDLTDLFQKTFTGLRLVSVYPMQRARNVISEALQPALAAENLCPEGSVLEQIRDNQWLGSEFLMWLLYGTTNARSDYAVNCDGPAAIGESFVAYLDNRFLLAGQGNEGAQKVTVVGPQDRFEEVRVALRQGKEIGEATIHIEKLEHQWRLTLKGELFLFGSFKCPTVRIEKGAEIDDERLSVFYERMHVLAEGFQLFDSLLASFLTERLAPDWAQRSQQIRQWLEN